MAQITTPCATLYPDITASVVADDTTGIPTAVLIQPGATDAVAWEILFQGTSITGSAPAGAPLQTITLNGATSATDLQSVALGQLLTANGGTFAHKAG